jgi:hypothetical protein
MRSPDAHGVTGTGNEKGWSQPAFRIADDPG